MGDYQRKLFKPRNATYSLDCIGRVHGKTEISKGDFLFLDRSNGIRDRGTSTADWYVYPFSKISGSTLTLASNVTLAKKNFLGIASWHSDSGVTEEIGVCIQGSYRYPLKGTRTVKVGYTVVPTGSGVTLYNQKLQVDIDSAITNAIGRVSKSGNFQVEIDCILFSSIFRGGAIIQI